MKAESKQLCKSIKEAKRIVFFGGAGVSTESDIPDFRSSDGLYQQNKYPYPAEVMLSHDFFMAHTQAFYDYYFHEMIYPHALPNAAHKALAYLEESGKLSAIITQNIDGLHQKAGSKKVLELHGSVHRNRCMHCHAFYTLEEVYAQRGQIPRCRHCSSIIKPEVVLYGEGLDQDVWEAAVREIAQADLLIVGGTSLVVYPAAGLLRYFKGKHLVLINRDETSADHLAQLVIHEPIGKVLGEVAERLKAEHE